MRLPLVKGPALLASRRIEAAQSAYFDLWRGLSAMLVMFAHAGQIFVPSHHQVLTPLAGGSVMVFFVLSGFFIHKSLAGAFRHRDWASYAHARINRIVPPFVFCILLTLALWWLAPMLFATGTREFLVPTTREGFALDGFWATVAFVNPFFGGTLSANGPLWSLSYEVWYYVLAGFLALALAGRRAAWLWLPAMLALTVLQPWFAVYGVLWAGGFYLSALHANDRLPALPRLPVWLVPVALYVALWFAPAAWLGRIALMFHLACGAWFLWHATAALQRPSLPSVPWLQRSAGFSYTLYVVHFPMLLFAYGIRPSLATGALAALVVLVFAAVAGPPVERIALFARRPRPAPSAPLPEP